MANEFKIKTGLLLGASPTQAVTSITDSSIFTNDSSTLASVNAIKNYVDYNTVASAGDFMTGDLDMSTNAITQVGYIDFDLNPTLTHTEGRLHWDDDDKTLEFGTEVSGTEIQIGQEQVLRATNKTGSTITNGSVVYINGAQGNRPTIELAWSDDDPATSSVASNVIGMATHDIANNGTGYITIFGLVRGVNTASYSEGDTLFLSADTSGGFTNVVPIAPYCIVQIGRVVVSHSSGTILISISRSRKLTKLSDVSTGTIDMGEVLTWTGSFWEASTGASGVSNLDDLIDVSITGKADLDFIQWDAANSVWINVAPIDASDHFTTITYVDAYNAIQDASILLKANKTDIDASFGLYETKTNLDTSFGLYLPLTQTNLDASFGLYETKTNLDTSFGLYEIKTNLDSSFGLYVEKAGDTMTGQLTTTNLLSTNGLISGGSHNTSATGPYMSIYMMTGAQEMGRMFARPTSNTGYADVGFGAMAGSSPNYIPIIMMKSTRRVGVNSGNPGATFEVINSSASIDVFELQGAGSAMVFNVSNDGSIYAPGIDESSQTKGLFYNTGTGEITYDDPCTGSGGVSTLADLTDVSVGGSIPDASALVYNSAGAYWTYGTGGSGGSSYWTLDGSTLSPTDPTVDVKLGSIDVSTDAGAVTLVDMEVTSGPAQGTEESYSFDIDGSTVAKVWGEADSAGALQEYGFVVETAQYMGDPNTNGSWRFYPDSNGDLVFEKRISGTWTEKGKFTE